MRKLPWLLIGLVSLNVLSPSGAGAQQKEDPQDFMKDVLGPLFGPNWNVFVTGGFTTEGRLLLQRPAGAGLGEQSVQTNTGYNFGIGGGGDYLLRQGYRFYYAYSSNDVAFKTNNGDGSSVLDVETNATLKSNTIGIELIRYLLPSRATITPYGTVGILGTWWGLDTAPLVQAPGGTTQFRMGANVAFGLQVRTWEQFGVRLEASSLTIGNPFTGKSSYRTLNAVTLDEPTSVGRWDYRLAGVYYFQKKSAVKTK